MAAGAWAEFGARYATVKGQPTCVLPTQGEHAAFTE